jgi:hypothetical protein
MMTFFSILLSIFIAFSVAFCITACFLLEFNDMGNSEGTFDDFSKEPLHVHELNKRINKPKF